MKIINKEIKECENTDGTKTYVLDLEYTHRWETWKILIKDYKEEFYEEYLQELRKQVRNLYTEQKIKREA